MAQQAAKHLCGEPCVAVYTEAAAFTPFLPTEYKKTEFVVATTPSRAARHVCSQYGCVCTLLPPQVGGGGGGGGEEGGASPFLRIDRIAVGQLFVAVTADGHGPLGHMAG